MPVSRFLCGRMVRTAAFLSIVLSCGAPFAHAAGGWTLTSTVTGASAPSGTTSSPAPFSALAASTDGSYLGWIAPYSSYGAGRFSAAGQALGPASVAGSSGSGIGPVGILFVAETPAGGLLASDSVRSQVFEYDSSGVEVQTIGVPGAAAGELSAPGGVAVAPDDTILVADTGNDRIQRFSSSGTHLATYGSPGTLDGQLDGPAGIAVNPNGSFWIADTNNHRVQLWSAAGGHLLTFGVQGSGPGEMENPIGIGVLSSGEIVASDDNLDRVTRYSAAGTFVNVVADAGADPEDLTSVSAMTVLADDTILVADDVRSLVQTYSEDGSYLGPRHESIGGASGLSMSIGAFSVPGSSSEVFLTKTGGVGSGPVLYRCALVPLACNAVGTPGVDFGITIDGAVAADGTIVVADIYEPLPSRLTASGTKMHTYGIAGTGPGSISASTALDIADDGSVWIADIADSELEHFTLAGTYVETVSVPVAGIFVIGFDALSDGTFLIHVRGQDDDTLMRISASGSVLWQRTSSQEDLTGGGILELGDGTFALVTNAFQVRRVSDGTIVSQTPIPAGSFPVVLFGVTRLADGRVLVVDAPNNRLHIFTQDSLQLAPSIAPPANVGGAAGDQVLRFEVAGAVGALSYTAKWGTDSAPITSDGSLSTASLPEGRRVLRVVATEQGGRTAVWEQMITVDRTAPVVASEQRFTTSINVALTITDAVTSPTVARRGIRAPRLGRNAASVLVADTVGNRAVREVVIIRRPSLVDGSLNRGLELWRPPGNSVFAPGNGSLNAVFGGGVVTRGPYSPALVREIQFRLKHLGRMSRVVRSTGQWDAPTRRSLRSFQRANKLPATGLPDRTTRMALDIALIAL